MRAATLPLYLIGHRRAILDVATSPWSMLIGALFVLSAGLAREYDGEYLLREPWHALRPLGASLASGTLLFIIVHGAAVIRGDSAGAHGRPPLLRAYRSWMGLFWMTAPMAWLYAIPYERWMTPETAIEWNLLTLALVALWRVVLMARVVTVVYGVNPASAFFLVMLFADAVVIAVIGVVPVPVIDVMGGVRGPAREELLGAIALLVMIVAVFSSPIWIIGALISLVGFRPMWPVAAYQAPVRSRGLLVCAVVSIVAFAPLLIWAQPEQALRFRVERLLLSGRVAEGLEAMSSHTQADFPPGYNPPPRLGYRETRPPMDEVRAAMREVWPADWVAQAYLHKTRRQIGSRLFINPAGDALAEYLEGNRSAGWMLEQIDELRDALQFLADFDPTLSEASRDAIRQLLVNAAAQESPSDASAGPA